MDVGRGITLCYEEFGDPSDPPVLLIMGLATQMIAWHEDFCEELVERGFHLVRFDNRDIGRSTHVDNRPPTTKELLLRRTPPGQYSLSDMAEDSAALMRELDIAPAHVVGVSMGGMIAQSLAINHPGRVLSLASMLSTTGNRRVGLPRMRALAVILRGAPSDRDAFVNFSVRVQKVIGSRQWLDEARTRRQAGEAYDRCHYPIGVMRQLVAIQTSGDRTEQLRRLDLPTVVLHGTKDPLVPPRAGRATAAAIPGAHLVELEGMAHDVPRQMWRQVIDAIVENTSRAARPQASVG